MSTFADDIRYDWSRDIMHTIGGEALLVAHPPGSPGREAVISAGLTALAEVETDVVSVGMVRGMWPMASDGWPLAAGHETSSSIRWTHCREAMAAVARTL